MAGTCVGIADYSSQDVTLVRVIVTLVSVITAGTAALAYPAAGPSAATAARTAGSKSPADRVGRGDLAGRRCV